MVRAVYRALEKDDDQALARHADPSIGWVDPMVSRLPFDGTRRGLPAVLRGAFRRDAQGRGPRVSAGTFLGFGDGVLVAGRLLDDRGEDGVPAEKPFLHECFVRGGKVVLIREYPAESKAKGAKP